MKICVSSQGKDLESNVDSRFGRCSFFIIIDTETMEFEAVDNNNAQAAGGAGIQSGQFLADKDVKALLTGNVGPNAFQTLQAAGIKIYTGVKGTVKEAVEQFKLGGLGETQNANVNSHFGVGRGN